MPTASRAWTKRWTKLPKCRSFSTEGSRCRCPPARPGDARLLQISKEDTLQLLWDVAWLATFFLFFPHNAIDSFSACLISSKAANAAMLAKGAFPFFFEVGDAFFFYSYI
jgi:hypothetical protein